MTDKDRTTLVQRLREAHAECVESDGGEAPGVAMWREAADELDRLNAQALELCAEISGLRRELAEANAELAYARSTGDECALEVQGWKRDAERLDWVERNLIEGKWDGTIGRSKSWHMVGPYRHTLQAMSGDTLREAIDAAMKEGER